MVRSIIIDYLIYLAKNFEIEDIDLENTELTKNILNQVRIGLI